MFFFHKKHVLHFDKKSGRLRNRVYFFPIVTCYIDVFHSNVCYFDTIVFPIVRFHIDVSHSNICYFDTIFLFVYLQELSTRPPLYQFLSDYMMIIALSLSSSSS